MKMKSETLQFFSVLIYFTLISRKTSACETTYYYTYIRNPRFPHASVLHKPPFIVCDFFNGLSYYKVIESVTITCSNVPQNLFLNYTYQSQPFDQDLVVTNSTIPKIPSNSTLSTFSKLRRLVLKNLDIEKMAPKAFQHLKSLHSLDLSQNRLKKIRNGVFDGLSTLNVLDLSHNCIRSVERGSLSGLVGLKELYLNDNAISVLEDHVFEDLAVLEILDVSSNPIKEFGNVGFIKLQKLFSKNTRLRRFNTDLSNLTLFHCDLSGGNLEVINFDNFPSKDIVNLTNNRLNTLHNFDKVETTKVFLNHNNITKLNNFPCKVKELDLSHNRIQFLNFENFSENSSLEILNLSFNQISEIGPNVFEELRNLKILNMHHNKIKVLTEKTFVNCSSLVRIDLSYNHLRLIENEVFIDTDNLEYLNVSHNNLKKLDDVMSQNINNLKELYVDHNEIEWFDANQLAYFFNSLKKITLNFNSWACEALSDLFRSLSSRNITIMDATTSDVNNVNGIACVYVLSN